MRRFILLISLCAVVLGAALFGYTRRAHDAAPQAANTSAESAPSNSAVVPTQSDSPAPSAQQPKNRPEAWADETFFVHDAGWLVAYSLANGQGRFKMPPGLLSADGKAYVAALPYPYESDHDATSVTTFDLSTGNAIKKFPIEGRWQLSALSNAGEWLVLTRVPSEEEKAAWTKSNTWRTDVRVYARNSAAPFRSLSLNGRFAVDAVSPSSGSLFLIEHRPANNPEQYVIRLYDLAHEQLQADALREKGSTEEVMTGFAWNGLATPDGQYLLTLYLNTQKNVAFIHTLDLFNRYPVCIFLPTGNGDANLLKQYTLTLSPNGRTVYAANAALGIVAEISLSRAQVTHVEQFTPNTFGIKPDYNVSVPTAHSVLSKDRSKLYFTSGWDVWAYDTQTSHADGPFLVNAPITALGVSGDGKRLYVATSHDPLLVFDTATGGALSYPRTTTSMNGQ